MPPRVEAPAEAPSGALRELQLPSARTFDRARRIALPLMLGGMVLLAFTPFRFVLQLFFAMWLHEFGHAVTSWFCGSVAVPLPWVTYGGETRSVSFIAIELLALGVWGHFKRSYLPLVITLGVLLLLGVAVSERTMQIMVVFGGDGGALVLGTLFMLTVFLPDEHRLSKGALRWGFLGIGAASFAVTLAVWVEAWRDPDNVPFGHIEGVGLSDPSKLVDVYGWSEPQLVHRYLGLAGVCLAVLVLAQVLALTRARTSAAGSPAPGRAPRR
jgi:hypothetical protein